MDKPLLYLKGALDESKMEKSAVFGLLAILSVVAIVFTPQATETWRLFLFLGVLFGIIWFFVKR